MSLFLDIGCYQTAQLLELLNHRWDNQIDDASHDGHHHYQRQHNAQSPAFYVHLILHKLHHGVKQISKEPRNDEGQQHTAQIVNQQQDAKHQQSCPHPTYQLVKCDCLFFHSLPLLLFGNTLCTMVRTR